MKRNLQILVILLFVSLEGIGQSITVSGGTWTPLVTSIMEAGNDYTSSTAQSSTSQTNISVSVPDAFIGLLGNSYSVNIKRIDSGTNWDGAGIQIWAKRIGDGTGGGSFLLVRSSITGGNVTFQQITTTNLYFFEGINFGTTPRSNITIQYEIRGISVLVPVNNYTTTIVYTLID
ncbi:hypothetical protein VB796_22075 [Arcicella sp. LKC2W]|uniref:hypothetical protein n=1 Tax=Arcicella sp. LKC2W TaxID=2984198 RepID=UPI002B1EB1E5|nr:hypothetical protein [Arcicella sp. LKC2W]MEA5461773.1 hypothetical protein [Arcicella sp. LKC2W]